MFGSISFFYPICTDTCNTYTHAHTRTNVHMHTCTYAHKHMFTNTNIQTWMCAHTHIRTHTHAHAHRQIYTTHRQIHTHTHARNWQCSVLTERPTAWPRCDWHRQTQCSQPCARTGPVNWPRRATTRWPPSGRFWRQRNFLLPHFIIRYSSQKSPFITTFPISN